MKGLKRLLGDFERVISVILLAFLSIILFIEVLFRYIFYTSVGWIGEISGFVFIWFIYLSISHITKKGAHIRVEIVNMFLPRRWLNYLDFCTNLLWLAFNLLMTYYGIQLILSVIRYPFRTPILDISMAYPYAIIPLAFGTMTVRLLVNMRRDFIRSNTKQKFEER
ncbi:MAG: TRAP transporter small permease [Deltaproteobacteria bacterium]|nr:TRAP transporter small permease [Deltaproteobacteria bacterium]MBW2309125.1 TRAP transporter small permease [Deltaproteobacteria bacterium]